MTTTNRLCYTVSKRYIQAGTTFEIMEKKILYHIGLYGFRKLIVYVIKDNGDNISIVSLNKDGSFPNTFGTVICIT